MSRAHITRCPCVAGWESHLRQTTSRSFDLHQTIRREELSDPKQLNHRSETHSHLRARKKPLGRDLKPFSSSPGTADAAGDHKMSPLASNSQDTPHPRMGESSRDTAHHSGLSQGAGKAPWAQPGEHSRGNAAPQQGGFSPSAPQGREPSALQAWSHF